MDLLPEIFSKTYIISNTVLYATSLAIFLFICYFINRYIKTLTDYPIIKFYN